MCCNNILEGEKHPETVNHFIFDYPAFDDERQKLERDMERRDLTLWSMMKDKKGLKNLARYISKTGRLKDIHL